MNDAERFKNNSGKWVKTGQMTTIFFSALYSPGQTFKIYRFELSSVYVCAPGMGKHHFGRDRWIQARRTGDEYLLIFAYYCCGQG